VYFSTQLLSDWPISKYISFFIPTFLLGLRSNALQGIQPRTNPPLSAALSYSATISNTPAQDFSILVLFYKEGGLYRNLSCFPSSYLHAKSNKMSNSSSSLPAPAATTFTLFSSLAPELRIKIWQYACAPRTVSVRYIPSLDSCLSPSKPPAILQTCHESRVERSLFRWAHGPALRGYISTLTETLYTCHGIVRWDMTRRCEISEP